MSKYMFMHTLLEWKSIFAIELKAIVACFVKNVVFLLGHPVNVVGNNYCKCTIFYTEEKR